MGSAITNRGETKERLLDAAERLFGAHGFAATSLRSITAAAGVNVAAVHYHFGSREALLRAVLSRRTGPLNRVRLARLDALEERRPGPTVEEILEAFLSPALEAARGDPGLPQVAGLLFNEPAEVAGKLIEELFGEVARRFHAALGRALPELSPEDVYERLGFVVGVLVHEIAGRHPLPPAERRRRGIGGRQESVPRMVAFLAAGMRAGSAGGGAG